MSALQLYVSESEVSALQLYVSESEVSALQLYVSESEVSALQLRGDAEIRVRWLQIVFNYVNRSGFITSK